MDYFDEVTTGLALRVTEIGSKSWTYNFTINDKRARMTLGTHPALSLSAARTKAIEARGEVEAGNDPRLVQNDALTLKAVRFPSSHLSRSQSTYSTKNEGRYRCNSF